MSQPSIRPLKDALITRRNALGMTRPDVAEAAIGISGSHPDFTTEDVRRLEVGVHTPTMDGHKLRTHCSAVGLPWIEALALIGSGYWPPLDVGQDTVVAELRATCERLGVRVAHHDTGSDRLVIQL